MPRPCVIYPNLTPMSWSSIAHRLRTATQSQRSRHTVMETRGVRCGFKKTLTTKGHRRSTLASVYQWHKLLCGTGVCRAALNFSSPSLKMLDWFPQLATVRTSRQHFLQGASREDAKKKISEDNTSKSIDQMCVLIST